MSSSTFNTINKATQPPDVNSEAYINSEKKNAYLSNEAFLKEKALQALDLLNNSKNKSNIQSGLFWKRGNVNKRFSLKKWVKKMGKKNNIFLFFFSQEKC